MSAGGLPDGTAAPGGLLLRRLAPLLLLLGCNASAPQPMVEELPPPAPMPGEREEGNEGEGERIESDLVLLARLIFGEARGEDQAGKVAVGHVVLNRLARPWRYGHTLRDVVFAPGQFSCWLPGPHRAALDTPHTHHPRAWRRSLEAAAGVLSGRWPDPTDGATHYLSGRLWRSNPPSWSIGEGVEVTELGGHVFLRGVR